MVKRMAIRLAPHEDQLLRRLYVTFNIPTDQYKMRRRDAARFLDQWNMRSGRSDEWGDVLHYMVTKRKNKKFNWPTLGDGHQRMSDPQPETLSDREWRILADVGAELLVTQKAGSDNLLFDPALAATMARMFAARAGRVVLSETLEPVMHLTRVVAVE